MKQLILKFLPLADALLVPLVYPAAGLLKQIRRVGVHRVPRCKEALMNVGVFPKTEIFLELTGMLMDN